MESRLFRLLASRIEERRATVLESIANGQAPDYAAYKDSTGYIRALDEVLVLAEEIDKGQE